ncbi:CoA transferase, partial [Mesorhizobium sp.]
RIAEKTTDEWLAILEPADIWCAKVLTWPELMENDGFKALDMLQTVTREDNVSILTTRSPLRVDGARARVDRAAPRIGEHSEKIRAEFGL